MDKTRLPLIVSVPIELPGDSVPPLMVVDPTEPVPPRNASLSTVTGLTTDPLTIRPPATTLVGPV